MVKLECYQYHLIDDEYRLNKKEIYINENCIISTLLFEGCNVERVDCNVLPPTALLKLNMADANIFIVSQDEYRRKLVKGYQ